MNVHAWLEELRMSAYAEAFAENGIDAALLPELSNEDLKDLGVARLADRKRLLKAIEELTASAGTDGLKPSPAVTPAGEHHRTAIDHAVAIGAWDRADHYAARLEDFTRGQPLAWPDFMIARARAFAAWGRGTRSRELVAELERLRECAVQHGLALAMGGVSV